MNLRQLRQSIGHLKTRIFGLAPTDEPYGRQEMEQLAAANHRIRAHETRALWLSPGPPGCWRCGDAVARNDRQGAGGAAGSRPC